MDYKEEEIENILNSYLSDKEDYLVLIIPFIKKVIVSIFNNFKKSKINLNFDHFVVALFDDIRLIWAYRFQKAFILELHQSKVAGLLKGDTAEKRYTYFVKSLLQAQNQKHFFKLYPVLKKQIESFIKLYPLYFKELSSRLIKDSHAVLNQFGIDISKAHVLDSIKFVGDPHHNFRRVAILEFLNEHHGKISLVYKPRTIKNEVFFNEFIEYLNPSLTYPLKHYQCLEKNNYGWCEYISKKNCDTPEQVKEYYHKFGVLTAIAYALGLYDMHYENLIASGPDPIIIDLECLGLSVAEINQQKKYYHTVLNSGMLPSYMIERNGANDSSAFAGGGEECEIIFENSYLKNTKTDDIHVARKSGYFPLQANRPILNSKVVIPYEYKQEVIEGFVFGYEIILEKRKDILRDFARKFSAIRVRMVIRPTSLYMKLIGESYHPNLLKKQVRYDKHFGWLKGKATSIHITPESFNRIVSLELAQIANNDVPLFYLKKNKVYDAYGKETGVSVGHTLASEIKKKIKSLSQKDLKLQQQLMIKSIDTYKVNYGNSEASKHNENEDDFSILLAKKIENTLDHLLENCLNQQDWIWPQHKRFSIKDKHYWILVYSQFDLYSGSLGVLLALNYASDLIEGAKYDLWLDQGLQYFLSLTEDEDFFGKNPDFSLFNGLGGLLYICLKLNNKSSDIGKKIINNIFNLLNAQIDSWLKNYHFDIIPGIAGLMLVLDLCAISNIKRSESLIFIKKMKNFLLTEYPHPAKLPKKAHTHNNKKAVLGFSHGVSGIAYALYRTENHIKPDKRVIKWVKEALAYERKNFDLEYQGWPNTFAEESPNTVSKKDLFQTDWCHGALGIGLSRLELKKFGWKDNYIDQEIAISILALKAEKIPTSLNLCHGALGRFDYYMRLHKEGLIDSMYLEEQKNNLLSSILNEDELISEVQAEIFIPGLMTGQAGLVYQLLRILYPEKVPSVLTIE